jgi:hypothetical protein
MIGVDTSQAASIFYWLSFVIGKIGLLTFNFMFALYMTVLLERLRVVGKTVEYDELDACRINIENCKR